MGGSSSKGQVLPPQPQRPPEPPYLGPPVEYNFLNTQVSMTGHMTLGSCNNMVSTNIDTYYPILGQKYAEGFRLLTFYRIPGAQQKQGLFSMTVHLTFQGVFCRIPQMPSQPGWQLRVVKSLMVAQRMGHGLIQLNPSIVGDTSHIYQAIQENTQTGGRLICIEMTGQQQGQGFSAAMSGRTPIMGVDLFFEVPTQPMAEQYIYQSVPVPVVIRATMAMGFGKATVLAQCDWNGALASQLSQGWKLIEVFFDMGQHRHGAFSTAATLNSVWFFEKPTSRLHDNTPMYQGTVVEHYIRITGGLGGSNTQTNWEPLVQQMGNNGWELACFIELPEVRVTGFGVAEMKVLVIFQRLILPPVGPPGPPTGIAEQGFAPPPAAGSLYPNSPPMNEKPPPYDG